MASRDDPAKNRPANERPSAAPFVPTQRDLAHLQDAAQHCKGCALYRDATQTVFGEGSSSARLLILGEVPGDQEDKEGKPFIGPAGRVLREALAEVGFSDKQIYVTNAVKHFKYSIRGKRRLHQTPKAIEINACRPWLEAELATVQPEVILCLGATASKALLGASFRLTKNRGAFQQHPSGAVVLASLHPSAILRNRDKEARERQLEELREDLRLIRNRLSTKRAKTKKQ